jgi:hypothetical protein
MAESHILITLFHDLKAKIDSLNSKSAMMDLAGIEGLKEVVKSCDAMDNYIDSFIFKEQHIINIRPDYFSLTPTSKSRGHAGPTPAMLRYAANQEKNVMDRIDRMVQLGRDLDSNKEKPYFSIN